MVDVTPETPKTTRRRNLIIVAAICLLAVFLLGFVPQFQKASALRSEIVQRDAVIGQLQQELKIAKVRDLAALLYLELSRKNFGLAAEHAPDLFTQVRALSGEASLSPVKADLENIANQKDAVMANIAKTDPAAEAQVRDLFEKIHQLKLP